MQSTVSLIDVVKNDAFEAAKYCAELGLTEVILTHKDGSVIYENGNFKLPL